MLVSIMIAVLVVITVTSVYFFSQRSYRAGEIMAEITQNGRIIMDRITREIRQAREIVIELPNEDIDSPSEIIFHDGHVPPLREEGEIINSGENFLILSSESSEVDDFYKGMFVQITSGPGEGQIRKINSYDGSYRSAEIEENWDIIPTAGSTYKIDTSHYYIHYYLDDFGNIKRGIFSYHFSGDPFISVPWNAIPPEGQTLEVKILEEPEIVGEYVKEIKFWGQKTIDIFIILEKMDQEISLSAKILGRNL